MGDRFIQMKIRIIQITIILFAIIAINSVLTSVRADICKREGRESLKKNFPYLAVDKFSKALKLDSSDGEARGYLGISYSTLAERTNNKDELLKKVLYEMKDSRKTYKDPSINYHLAKTYELSGDVDSAIQEAIKSYNQIPSGQTKDKLIALYKIKGDMLLSQNKKDEAMKIYTKFVELKGASVTNGDITNYEFLRDLMPDKFMIRYCLAELYIGQSLWDKAVIELEYINKIGMSNEYIMGNLINAYYNLSKKYYNEKKFKEAERYLKSIINIDSIGRDDYSASAFNILSQIYEQTGEFDKAEETLIKLEEIDTQKGQGYYKIGILFNRNSNPKKAIEYFEKYLQFRPTSDNGIFKMLGGLYEQVGDIDNAVRIYSKLEEFNSSKGNGHYYSGLLYERKERWFDALEKFKHVLEIRPRDSQLLVKIGELYERTGDNRGALETYKKVLDIDPTKTTKLNLPMARLYEKTGERGKAVTMLKRSRML